MEGREQWGLFQCSEHLCNGVVVCVIISLWRSPSLCKQAELMSPTGLGDKDRCPHDSLTVEFNPLISSEPIFAKYKSSRTLTSWLHLLIGWPFTYGSVFFKKHKHNRWAGANIIFYVLDNIKKKMTKLKSICDCICGSDFELLINIWCNLNQCFYIAADKAFMSSRYYGSNASRGQWSIAVVDQRSIQIHFQLLVWFTGGMTSWLKQQKTTGKANVNLFLFIPDQRVVETGNRKAFLTF